MCDVHRGISAEEGNADGLTPLILACQTGRHQHVELLLKKARGTFLIWPTIYEALEVVTNRMWPRQVVTRNLHVFLFRTGSIGGGREQESGTGRSESSAQDELVSNSLRCCCGSWASGEGERVLSSIFVRMTQFTQRYENTVSWFRKSDSF